ncbi:unannotated protein [freshwater metagenome]|uniref:Unannotated protein n=1 Tax=freshwater metagenome TaxID=449393 RepID=A0A6J7JBK4_9ZZZZ
MADADSTKMTDSPAAIVVIPVSASDAENKFELSSIFQPVIVTGLAVVFVNSNQSAATGLLALDQGETSETKTEPGTACAGAMGASTPTATKAAPHPRTTVLANLPLSRNLIERLPVQCVMHMP